MWICADWCYRVKVKLTFQKARAKDKMSSIKILLTALNVGPHLLQTSTDTTLCGHTHTSHLQVFFVFCFFPKAPRLRRKTQSPENNWPHKQICNKMEKAEQLSINQWTSIVCVGRANTSCQHEKKTESFASGKVAWYNLKHAISSDFRIKHTVRPDCMQGNQYSAWNVAVSKCCLQFGGLPGTKLPCTTSLYAHHPSWIFGGPGCAVR